MSKHLTLEQRHYIYHAHKKGESMRSIAKDLGKSHSTISREIQRNSGQRGYRYKQAHSFAMQRHECKPKAIKFDAVTQKTVIHYLMMDWSPEQISGWLKANNLLSIHHETIYRFLLKDKLQGGQLYKFLRHQGKPYRKRYGHPSHRTGIPDRVDIDQRPREVNQRTTIGHWEGDTIIGKGHQGAIVTLDERVSKFRLAMPLQRKQAQDTSDAIISLLMPIAEYVQSITYDNGKEFAKHTDINRMLGCSSYFAKPYHSWERGQNENANGLLRQYFPKSAILSGLTNEVVFEAVDKLNSRPRKCLGYKTPCQVFYEMTGFDTRSLNMNMVRL